MVAPMLRYLGTAQYGLWATMVSVAGMLNFADLGVANGVMNLVAFANGRRDVAAVRRAMASGFVLVAIAALILILATLVAGPFVDWSTVLAIKDPSVVRSASAAMLAMVLLFALNMPTSVVQKVQYGMQKGGWVGLSDALAALGTLVLIYAAVALDLGFVAVVVATMAGPILVNVGSGWLFARSNAAIVPRVGDLSWVLSRRLARTGAAFATLQVAAAICWGADNLIVAQVLGPSDVATYAVHQKLFMTLSGIATLAFTPLWPAYGDAVARGDEEWIKKALAVTCGSMIVLGLIGGSLLAYFSDWLMLHWLKGQIRPDPVLCQAFVAWVTVELLGRALGTLLNGTGMLRQQVVMVLFLVPVSIVLKILLARTWGLQGVAWGGAIAWLIVNIPAAALILPKADFGGMQLNRGGPQQ